jgi:hypothetical protein
MGVKYQWLLRESDPDQQSTCGRYVCLVQYWQLTYTYLSDSLILDFVYFRFRRKMNTIVAPKKSQKVRNIVKVLLLKPNH